MKIRHIALALIAAFGIASGAQAQITATCKDGTTYSGSHRIGACARHGGVKEWTSSESTATSPGPAVPTPNFPATPRGATANPPANLPGTGAAVGAGQVWVNTATHVYHCPGDRWYGKTKHGEYMSEGQARTTGNRPDHNKACS
jgi:uncharacterized protein DUF3761